MIDWLCPFIPSQLITDDSLLQSQMFRFTHFLKITPGQSHWITSAFRHYETPGAQSV